MRDHGGESVEEKGSRVTVIIEVSRSLRVLETTFSFNLTRPFTDSDTDSYSTKVISFGLEKPRLRTINDCGVLI